MAMAVRRDIQLAAEDGHDARVLGGAVARIKGIPKRRVVAQAHGDSSTNFD